MNDKKKAEIVWQIVEFTKTLTDDPAEQSEALLNANSFIQNSIVTDTLRATIRNYLSPK